MSNGPQGAGRGGNRGGGRGGNRGRGGYGRRGGRGPRGHGGGARLPVPEDLPRFHDAWSVVLTPNILNLATAGHPWIYSGGVAHALPPTAAGDEGPKRGQPCGVFGPDGEAIGHGTYNGESQIRVRMLGLWQPDAAPRSVPTLAESAEAAFKRAKALRAHVGLPGEDTDALRLVNSEGDGLPGLVVDRMATGAVVLVSTAAAARMADTVVALLRAEGLAWVVVRTAGDTHPSEGLAPGVLRTEGEIPDAQWVHHHGLRFRAEPLSGQKSGLYTDQFSNHLAVAALAKGRSVLDCYSHGGGFGLHAAKAGATRVRCVDMSQRAVDLAAANAEENGLSDRVEGWCGDAVHILRDIADGIDTDRPDLIVLDPPKFATRADVVDDALKKYVHVNATAMRALPADGLLVTCSCSGRIDQQTFVRMLAHAGRKAGRSVQVLELRGAAPDHPSVPAHGESRYLKVAICRVSDRG